MEPDILIGAENDRFMAYSMQEIFARGIDVDKPHNRSSQPTTDRISDPRG